MPEILETSLKRAADLLHKNRLDDARNLLGKLTISHSKYGGVWALDSEAALRSGDLQHAWKSICKATEINAQDPRRHVQKARCAVLLSNHVEASKSVKASLLFGVSRVDDLLTLASVMVRCGDHDGALTMYQRVEVLDPKNLHQWRGVASVYRFLGDTENALFACDKTLLLNPHDYETQYLRSSLEKQTSDNNHIAELTAIYESGVRDWRGGVQIKYALSKEYEDIGEYVESFKNLSIGANLRRKNLKYDAENDLRIFPALRGAFSKQVMQDCKDQNRGDLSDAPIFVLGLPRTGSTLVERIVSSHSKVSTAGELNDFALELMELVREKNNGQNPNRLELPKLTLAVDMEELGSKYLRSAGKKASGTKHFIDKLPLNSLYVGLIRLALPNAKVVHVRRNPIDACYAMYKFNFKNGYPFSYNLNELADYYIGHHQLMQHWRAVLPEHWMLDLDYEKLVSNQVSETERLLNFLELEWEENCLDFQHNKQASTTGSASQVRQPLYSSSVGKWRNYEQQLQPLIEKLAMSGVLDV